MPGWHSIQKRGNLTAKSRHEELLLIGLLLLIAASAAPDMSISSFVIDGSAVTAAISERTCEESQRNRSTDRRAAPQGQSRMSRATGTAPVKEIAVQAWQPACFRHSFLTPCAAARVSLQHEMPLLLQLTTAHLQDEPRQPAICTVAAVGARARHHHPDQGVAAACCAAHLLQPPTFPQPLQGIAAHLKLQLPQTILPLPRSIVEEEDRP